jgi:hypothetical protein
MGLLGTVFGLFTSWLVLPDLRPIYSKMDLFHKLLFLVSLEPPLTLLKISPTSTVSLLENCSILNFDQEWCNLSKVSIGGLVC